MGELVAAREPRPMPEAAQAADRRPATVGELVWLAVLPCAVFAIAAGLLLGRPLGAALFAPGPAAEILPGALIRPEPTEHARYVVAVLAPLLLVGVAVLAARRRIVASRPQVVAVAAVELLLVGFVAFLFVAQHTLTYRSGIFTLYPPRMYFTWRAVAFAVLAAGALAALLRSEAATARLRHLASETPARRRVCLAL